MSQKRLSLKIACALIASVLLLPGCMGLARQHQIPDDSIPHRLAKPVTATVFVRQADGSFVEEVISIPAGWWVASPKVVDP